MIIDKALILENVNIAKDVYRMKLKSAIQEELMPGKFVNIKIKGFMLRRPISIASIEDDYFVIIYKILGKGTKVLSTYKAGETIEVMGALGKDFIIHEDLDRVLLIGGGVGVPPLYEVAKRYRKLDKEVVAVLGFRNKSEVFLEDEFKELGVTTYISTDDGSYGFKGNAIQAIKALNIDIDFVYSVGPTPLLRAVSEMYTKGYISMEERMACGIGICMGCVCKDKEDKNKSYRVCTEGPVYEIGRIEL